MGPERPSAIISAESIRQTAYHEAGHALVALKTPGILSLDGNRTGIITHVVDF